MELIPILNLNVDLDPISDGIEVTFEVKPIAHKDIVIGILENCIKKVKKTIDAVEPDND